MIRRGDDTAQERREFFAEEDRFAIFEAIGDQDEIAAGDHQAIGGDQGRTAG